MKVQLGDRAEFAKTVSEADVYAFAGITGDFYAAHINEEAMKATSFGRRIAHGALLVGLMSAAATALIHKLQTEGDATSPVSLGYDGLRFVAPVFFGDTIEISYLVHSVDVEKRRTLARIEATNQAGETVAVGQHHMKWL